MIFAARIGTLGSVLALLLVAGCSSGPSTVRTCANAQGVADGTPCEGFTSCAGSAGPCESFRYCESGTVHTDYSRFIACEDMSFRDAGL